MSELYERIARNLDNVRRRIDAAAVRSGRDPGAVRLVAVTKAVGLDEARALHDLGVRDLAENRLESARAKVEALSPDIRWHMLAPIQRRKGREVVELFTVADAIDRVKVARTLQDRCEELDRRLEVLVEVNVSGEGSKHGFAPEDVQQAVGEMRPFDRLDVRGLMTMAPLGAEPDAIRSIFRRLRAQAEALDLPEVSMGMTDDFEIAVEEGATQVRIGRALYE